MKTEFLLTGDPVSVGYEAPRRFVLKKDRFEIIFFYPKTPGSEKLSGRFGASSHPDVPPDLTGTYGNLFAEADRFATAVLPIFEKPVVGIVKKWLRSKWESYTAFQDGNVEEMECDF